MVKSDLSMTQEETKRPDIGTAMVFKGAGEQFEKQSFNVRPLCEGEILVKNLYTTLCGSDIHTFCGHRKEAVPCVLGHEIVGEIVEIHPTHSGKDIRGNILALGNTITWPIFSSNPDSPLSCAGIPQKGENLFTYGHQQVVFPEVFHGGLAQFCILKKNTATLKLPKQLPLPVAATINCSMATVAGAIRMAGDLSGKKVLITGMGHLGLTCAAMCREAGASWIMAADVEDNRLRKTSDFGADATFNFNTNEETLQQAIRNATMGATVDVAFDMSGSPDAMEQGVNCLSIGGVAVWIGAVFSVRPVQINAEHIIRNLISIKGLHNYNYDDFNHAFDFISEKWRSYPFEDVVEEEFSLEETQQAFEYAVTYKPFRVGINLDKK